MKYYIIAGEASGDLHGANLIRSLRKFDPDAEFRFYGGDLMSAASGGTMVRHFRDTAVMGFVSVILKARSILSNIKYCRKDLAAYGADALILIDYPGFNLKIAKFAKKTLGLPVYYYIPPKVWAWKKRRVKVIDRYVDKVFAIFPFEPDFYGKHGCLKAVYVGNPCVQAVCSYRCGDRDSFVRENGLDANRKIIALLPGSRRQEVEQTVKLFERMDRCAFAGCQFVIAATSAVDKSLYEKISPDIRVVFDRTYELLSHSHAAVVNSGTATLETALFNVPQVVCYPMNVPGPLYRFARKTFLKIPYVSLVNIICGKKAVTELVAADLSVSALERELRNVVYDEKSRRTMLSCYREMKDTLGGDIASDKAAGEIVRTVCCK